MSAFQNLPVAPKSEKKTTTDTRHGITRDDNYAWMRDENWQEMFKDPTILQPKIREHLESENDYMEAVMADTKPLQDTLFTEMRARIKEADASIPMVDGPYRYGSEFVAGGERPRYFRETTNGENRQIYLDGDKEAGDATFFKLGGANHSFDHKLLVWGYDDKGSEFYDLKIRNLETLTDFDDHLTNTGGSAAWNADASGFYYTLLDENHRPSKMFFHKIGTQQQDDILIYEENDAGFFMSVSSSRLNDLIFIDIHDHETSESYILSSNLTPALGSVPEPQLIRAREKGIEYDVQEGGDCLYILTNIDSARDFKIAKAPINALTVENWQDVVAHKDGRLILGVLAFKNYLVWLERENGLPKIAIQDRSSNEIHFISFDEEAYSLGLSGSLEFDCETIRFNYSSMTTPNQQFEYNMRSRARVLLKSQEVPSGHESQDFITRRIFAKAKDGEMVPISLLYHKNTKLDGNAPCLLYGYGSYGIAIPASFNTNCLSLVERGFIYAIVHIRGGKEKGFAWYENGRRERKQNTFDDFIAAANHLVSANFTNHKKIVAQGGSAGGMLMGAVVNQAPNAFGAIIAAVPFVDVLNTMLDDTLPLTPPEWPEWGNPIESETDYKKIASYSPYDNVCAQAYPPILALAGLTDPRVTYWEPAKWVAKLREMKTNDAPVMLKTNMGAGHGGASGRFERLHEIALEYSFALKAVGKL